jgi:flagellar biosynthetic protein FliR
MTTRALVDLLPANVFALLIVFCRVGAAVMWMPGFGNSFVPVRTKLIVSLLLAVVVTPVLADALPALPRDALELTGVVVIELVIGSFFGLYANLLVAALETAGGIIAMQSSLASAIVFNPGEQKSETLPAALLAALAMVLIFSTDLHHMLLAVVVDSYNRFPAGTPLPMADLADAIARLVSRGFTIAIQVAAPYIVLGTLFHVALGLVGRIMPQLQIFYVGLPLQVLGGLAMLMVTIPASMIWFLGVFESMFRSLVELR